MPLSTAPDIDRIALSEVRALKEAQHGNSRAATALLEPYLSGIWSICLGHLGDHDRAISEVLGFREQLRAELPRLTLDQPFGLQLYRLLWLRLRVPLEPEARRGILSLAASSEPTPPPGDLDAVRAAIRTAPPHPRLIYLFWLITGLSAARLAQLLQEPELQVRTARALLVRHIHEVLDQ